MSIRPVKRIIQATPAIEGAGVKLRRGFGFGDTTDFDPFLLFDDFRNDVPRDFLAGFPWHPHRGIETITYVLTGTVEHGDSLGNRGALGAGDVQWMTAGSGIIHQENAARRSTRQDARLPALGQPARVVEDDRAALSGRHGTRHSHDHRRRWDQRARRVRRILGETRTGGRHRREPSYLDVSVPPGKRKTLPVEVTRHAFAYVFAGSGTFHNASQPLPVKTDNTGDLDAAVYQEAADRSLIVFDRGDDVTVQAGEMGIRFLLVSGKPLEEPIAWHGPVVMNTEEELRQAFREIREGTFIR
jgi:redox-sensitive bicupin YhaK (pirin superfamily)